MHHSILKQVFGYDSFRPGQAELVDWILSGRDALGVMPTGAGKSLCFQVPALCMTGMALVISPLISLMKDQVNALVQTGVPAAYINSSLSPRQVRLALERARRGAYRIMYIAPERLETAEFLEFARETDISMVTVDEAHCISQWGQDFRPSYLYIPAFIQALGRRPVVSAFTATATRRVREDITNLLALRDPAVVITGFDRPNLYFDVWKPGNKLAALMGYLTDKKEHSGIVYCATRKDVEQICKQLQASGFSAGRYHAGLSHSERLENQENFLHDLVRIMVATNAFGMGIDKSNVSFVVHYSMPKDIESYYQEAGRAGRDGQHADCILLFSEGDVHTSRFLIENSRDVTYPDLETERRVKAEGRRRLQVMTGYCHTTDCLRAYLLRYFGEAAADGCGNCGSCSRDYEVIDITEEAKAILTCVYRSGQQYGMRLILDMLRGSKGKRVLELGLDRLPDYGRLPLPESRLRDRLNYLAVNGYLEQTGGEYPILRLGARAAEVLRQNGSVEMKQAVKPAVMDKPVPEESAPAPVAHDLLAALKAVRLEIARRQEVPAFVVFSDSTLVDMCMKRPETPEDFLQVSGVGRVKLERYGGAFLTAIRAFPAPAGRG